MHAVYLLGCIGLNIGNLQHLKGLMAQLLRLTFKETERRNKRPAEKVFIFILYVCLCVWQKHKWWRQSVVWGNACWEGEGTCKSQMVTQWSRSPSPALFLTPFWMLHPPSDSYPESYLIASLFSPLLRICQPLLFPLLLFITFGGSWDSHVLYLIFSNPPPSTPKLFLSHLPLRLLTEEHT